MATKRQVEAYVRRLAKIELPHQLTLECLGAVLSTDTGFSNEALTGTLVGFRHEFGVGILGGQINTWVKVCKECVHQPGNGKCTQPSDADEIRINGGITIVRNE